MEIYQFPEVQLNGKHAHIRVGDVYILLGDYDANGDFVWSEEGIKRRDALLSKDEKDLDEVLESVDEPVEEDKVDADLAAAKARSAARNKKPGRK